MEANCPRGETGPFYAVRKGNRSIVNFRVLYPVRVDILLKDRELNRGLPSGTVLYDTTFNLLVISPESLILCGWEEAL
jgi:hypothetical protein